MPSASSSGQSEGDGRKRKVKKRKKGPGGPGGPSSSEAGSDSSSSSSESEVSSEADEEQEPVSLRHKTVRASAVKGGLAGRVPPPRGRAQRLPTRAHRGPLHPCPVFLFQPPSSRSAPAAEEVSLLDLEDCECGRHRSRGRRPGSGSGRSRQLWVRFPRA